MVLNFYFLVRKGSSRFLPILMAFIPIALALLSAWPEPAWISCSPDIPAILPVVSPLPTSSYCGPKLFHRRQAFPSSSRRQTPALSSDLPRTLLLNHVVSLFVPGHARGCGACISISVESQFRILSNMEKPPEGHSDGPGCPLHIYINSSSQSSL